VSTNFQVQIRRIALVRTAVRARRRFACAGALVALAVLASAPAAGAATWTVQPTPLPFGWGSALFTGVSCPSATACMAVGDITGGSLTEAWGEVWNGTSWTSKFPRLPGGATFSFFSGVSCPSATGCMAVGQYVNGSGTDLPLAAFYTGSGWTIEPTQIPSGAAHSQLNGVSCTSATACTAVGSYGNNTTNRNEPLAEVWDGNSWTVQQTPVPSGADGSSLEGVSCASVSACVAVGDVTFGVGVFDTFAERWNGISWFKEFPVNRSNTFNQLQGVSCTSASSCLAVGNYSDPASHNGMTLGELSPGIASWTPQSTPSPGTTNSYLDGVSCTSNGGCLAVGGFDDIRGTQVPLVDSYDGFNWSFVQPPSPTGAAFVRLTGVSCSATTACMAVGFSKNAAGRVFPLAERFSSSPGPHGLSLTPAGRVLELLRKPREIELLVLKHGKRETYLGAVSLGKHPAGRSSSHWNLRVNGRRLRGGRYRAELVAYGPGFRTDGPSVTFELTHSGGIQVLSATCSVTAAALNRC
jgi:hypothetical protein